MAIAVTSTEQSVFGNKKIVMIAGTFASGDTTGDVVTGLNHVDFSVAQYESSAKIINTSDGETGTITVATQDPTATKVWTLFAIGY